MTLPACSVSVCSPLPQTHPCPQEASVAFWSHVHPWHCTEQGPVRLSVGTYGVYCVRTSRAALANPNACGFGFATSVKYPSEGAYALGRVVFRSRDQRCPAVDPWAGQVWFPGLERPHRMSSGLCRHRICQGTSGTSTVLYEGCWWRWLPSPMESMARGVQVNPCWSFLFFLNLWPNEGFGRQLARLVTLE